LAITGDDCGKLLLNGEVIWDIEYPIVVSESVADAAKLALEGLQRKEEGNPYHPQSERRHANRRKDHHQRGQAARTDGRTPEPIKSGFSLFTK
jgi:hypothetical protein